MNIILASAEVSPFAKLGGLGDIASSLPLEWVKYGQTPIVIMPKYKDINIPDWGFHPTNLTLFVPMGWWTEYARLWEGRLPGTNVPVYLVENNDYFDRHGIYGDPHEFIDNDRRLIFFCRSIFEAAKALSFTPDIIHAHDFHTAFTMAFLKTHYKNDFRFLRTAGVYTVHNLAFQGWFDPVRALDYAGYGMKAFFHGSWFEHFGKVNAMKAGIMFADKITTVSPTYSKEIRTPSFSEGMQDVLNSRGDDLIGILNGVNYNEWSPEIDDFLFAKYFTGNTEVKNFNKMEYLREYGITEYDNPELPLIGMVSRLTEQKGIDILNEIIEYYLSNNIFRFTLLGTGERRYEDYFNYLRWKYPKLALTNIGYNSRKSHLIIASSDYLLMPSKFEPCGLTQMYAIRYGTIPIVRSTGGLADTVEEYNPESFSGNGFLFDNFTSHDFATAINNALTFYKQKPHWDNLQQNAMAKDFSSSHNALDYLKVFKWALEKVRLP
ncbi:MAG: glycogen synthase [Ignavibacteria bacterium]|nr:glycogen synthase [Ignavibacteria bacterium]